MIAQTPGGRYRNRADDRARAVRAHQQPDELVVQPQRPLGYHRRHLHVREQQQVHKHGDHDGGEYHAVGFYVDYPFPEVREDAGGSDDGGGARRRFQNQQEHDADHVEREDDEVAADGFDRGDEDAGERRPRHAAAVHPDRIQRHAVGDARAPDDVHDDGAAGRHVESPSEPAHEHDHVGVPELRHAEKQQRTHGGGGAHVGDLRRQQDFAPVRPVGENAAERPEQQQRDHAEEADQRHAKGGIGQLQHKQNRQRHLHPAADEREEVGGPEQAKAAMPKGVERRRHPRVSGSQA